MKLLYEQDIALFYRLILGLDKCVVLDDHLIVEDHHAAAFGDLGQLGEGIAEAIDLVLLEALAFVEGDRVGIDITEGGCLAVFNTVDYFEDGCLHITACVARVIEITGGNVVAESLELGLIVVGCAVQCVGGEGQRVASHMT